MTVTDAVGCTVTDDVTVTVEDSPEITNYTTVSPNCGLADGSITVEFDDHPTHTGIEFSIDGGSTYAYTVADDAGSYTFANLGSGVYSIYARWEDQSCPNEVAEVQLNDIAGPTVDLGPNIDICDDGTNTSATLTASVSGGQTPYTYVWDQGLSGDPSHIVAPSVTNRVSGYRH